jgi:hypothetical protein
MTEHKRIILLQWGMGKGLVCLAETVYNRKLLTVDGEGGESTDQTKSNLVHGIVQLL